MENNLLSVWGTIGSVLLAILMLLVMITIHEFGHYIAGKIFHFKINEFSIGFGPALFKRKSKKTGELFAIRLIPLGGYCAFDGEDGLEEEPTPKKKRKKDEEEQVFADLAPAEPEASAPVEEIKPVKKELHPDAFTNKKPWQRIIVLIAGALMNYLLALFMILVGFFGYGQSMIAVWKMDAPTEEYRAEYSLQDLDIMLEADGRSLYLTTDIAKAVNGKHKGDMVEMKISRVVGKTEDDKNIREEITVSIMLREDVNVKNSADFNCVWRALGMDNEDGVEQLATTYYKFGFFETLGRSFVYSFKIAGSIFKVIGELLTGQLGIAALGGPVTTISMTSQMVSRGFRAFLEIGSFIGVNLAVFNLLPIPALDGSKVVFTAIEWVRGKPISRKIEAIIHAVGFVLLLGFAVLVDLLQFI
ncbi:MAG: site-2 protease family protein [Clostridiales bacterium]|nr:site-2 protease family protein [Clostridiales bacterium]